MLVDSYGWSVEMTEWFDNHCHLTTMKDDAAEAVAFANAAGVTKMLTVGCDVADSRQAIEIAKKHDGVWATAGVHPHDAKSGIDGLEALLAEPKVLAVGECGLDYHYDNSPRVEQREVFEQQIDLAHRHDLALVIHTREAWDDTFAILDACGMPARTVFHCFSGGPAEAEKSLERGAYLSFSGIITFKTADELRAAAEITPIDRLLVETDAPFLTPVPHRGQPNRPALVPFVGAEIAKVKKITVEDVASSTWVNGRNLYGE
ncbi:MAG: TatD DNase family protein [Acidimicrobiales bacterium]|jgi:TatD DNase family protein